MDINFLAEEIRNKIFEGSNELKSTRVRTEVEEEFRRSGYEKLLKLSQDKPDELMPELVKFFMVMIWPNPPDLRFCRVAEQLNSINEIEEILNVQKLNETVCIGTNICVEERIPLDEFKKSLLEKIFNS